MSELPNEQVTVRGSAWGPVTTYWFAVAAWLIIFVGIGRGNPMIGGAIAVIGLMVIGLASFAAAGTEISVGASEVRVKRRFRGTWAVPGDRFDRVDEHIPMRPRAPSMAGWQFFSTQGDSVTVEVAMLSPLSRRRIRKALGDRIIDVEKRMQRRKHGLAD